MIITTALEAAAVLFVFAGLLNEPRLIEWERRTAQRIKNKLMRKG